MTYNLNLFVLRWKIASEITAVAIDTQDIFHFVKCVALHFRMCMHRVSHHMRDAIRENASQRSEEKWMSKARVLAHARTRAFPNAFKNKSRRSKRQWKRRRGRRCNYLAKENRISGSKVRPPRRSCAVGAMSVCGVYWRKWCPESTVTKAMATNGWWRLMCICFNRCRTIGIRIFRFNLVLVLALLLPRRHRHKMLLPHLPLPSCRIDFLSEPNFSILYLFALAVLAVCSPAALFHALKIHVVGWAFIHGTVAVSWLFTNRIRISYDLISILY